MKGFKLVFILSFFVLSNCSSGGRQGSIDEDRFVDIYVEVALAREVQLERGLSRDDYLKNIFQRYNFTYEEFQAALKFYQKNPERWERLFKKIVSKLRTIEVGERKPERRKIHKIEP